MFDWLRTIGHWLERYVIALPIYYAAPAMIVIGALDSSLLSLPEINDYLVVGRCIKQPSAAFYFPLFAAIGSVLGCLLLYTIMRRGGQAVLKRRFKRENIERVERAYARYGFLAIAVPAVIYGRRVLSFMKDNGLVVLSIVAGAALLIFVVYTIGTRRKPAQEST